MQPSTMVNLCLLRSESFVETQTQWWVKLGFSQEHETVFKNNKYHLQNRCITQEKHVRNPKISYFSDFLYLKHCIWSVSMYSSTWKQLRPTYSSSLCKMGNNFCSCTFTQLVGAHDWKKTRTLLLQKMLIYLQYFCIGTVKQYQRLQWKSR